MRPRIHHAKLNALLQAPFVAVGIFGLYSIAAVLYGVFAFEDCPEEAASLRMVRRRSQFAFSRHFRHFQSSCLVAHSRNRFGGAADVMHRSESREASLCLQDIAMARADLVKKGVLQ